MTKLRWVVTAIALLFSACDQSSERSTMSKLPQVVHPEWSKSASIYEVNFRQFTPEGTFKAFESHVPRLKDLGVEIIWLMPIQPIGVVKRKGDLGSYYSIKDYYDVNPEFGTKEDLQHLVNVIHEAGLHVIIDWVGNHTSWDNVLASKHPDWYQHDFEGNFIAPIGWDWSDVIVLDYHQDGLREYMLEAMIYWVKEFDIDGYRCDVAGYVPTDFWVTTRGYLEKIKPIFMLAEWDDRAMHYAFDMTYGWELEEAMQAVATGKEDASAIRSYMAKMINSTSRDEIKMTFTSNHDKNSWEGSVFERFGKASEMFGAMTFCLEGMPLIYGGQEIGLKKSLAFFEKDQIEWGDHPFNSLYARLNKLKKDNIALWNGDWGGRMYPLQTNLDDKVLVVYREKDGNRVLSLFNCSPDEVTFQVRDHIIDGEYKSFKGRNTVNLKSDESIVLGGWGYQIYTAR